MNWNSCRAAAALAALLTGAVAADASVQNCAGAWDDVYLAGTIGNLQVHLAVMTGHPAPDGGVFGALIYPHSWRPDARTGDQATYGLRGTIDDCRLRLVELTQTGTEGATWEIRAVDATRAAGTRQVGNGPVVPVALTRRPPPLCATTGSWRRFDDPAWPITFEYPVEWALHADGATVTIDCPDASRQAQGGDAIRITVEVGDADLVHTVDGQVGRSYWPFLLTTSGAVYQGETCKDRMDRLMCLPARSSPFQGMTVLQGTAGEHRRYAPGWGYAGQGGGLLNYALLLPDRWVSIISERAPEWFDDLLGHGPVRFDGDGITERLVRSIQVR